MTWTDKNGTLIRKLREQTGITQRELASRMDVSPSWISTIESGKSQPSFASLQKIADALQIPLTHVLGEHLDVISPELKESIKRPVIQELLIHVTSLSDEKLRQLIKIADALTE